MFTQYSLNMLVSNIWLQILLIANLKTLILNQVIEEKGENKLEECPNCGKWTLTYNPKAEIKICMNCNYRKNVKYELFIEQKNVINYLSYPNHRRVRIAPSV